MADSRAVLGPSVSGPPSVKARQSRTSARSMPSSVRCWTPKPSRHRRGEQRTLRRHADRAARNRRTGQAEDPFGPCRGSAEMVSRGEVDFVVSGLPPLIGTPNIEWLGYLPDEIQSWLCSAAASASMPGNRKRARAVALPDDAGRARGVQGQWPGAAAIGHVMRPAEAPHWCRAIGHTSRAGTSAPAPAWRPARNRVRNCRKDDSASAGPGSSTRRPRAHAAPAPDRRNRAGGQIAAVESDQGDSATR